MTNRKNNWAANNNGNTTTEKMCPLVVLDTYSPVIDAAYSRELTPVANSLPVIHTTNRETEDEQTLAIAATNKERSFSSLDDIATLFREYERGLNRREVPLGHIRVGDDCLIADSEQWQFANRSVGQDRLCQKLGIPKDYFRKLPPVIRSRLVEHHLSEQRRNSDHAGTILIYGRDTSFVGFGRADLETLSVDDILEGIRTGVNGYTTNLLQVADHAFENEQLTLKLITPVHHEVRRGDVIHGGIEIQHSLIGESATQILSFVYRLVCSNGMTYRECLGRSRMTPRTRRLRRNQENSRQMQIEQIRQLVAKECQSLQNRLEVIAQLQEKDMKFHQVERFLRQGRLFSQNLWTWLEEAWREEGREETGFGLLNALTRVATHHSELTPRQRRLLSRLAGVFAFHQVHICPRCYSIMDS